MSQNQSVDEVMQKIRARVAERNVHRGSSLTSEQFAFTAKKQDVEPNATTRATGPRDFVTADFSHLQMEIDTAVEGSRRVGQLNPRNPGLLNVVIQFFKKVMRRSLSWYTRPIHYFQGGVIRALQQTEVHLRSHDRALRSMSEEASRQSGVVGTKAAELSRLLVKSDERISDLVEANGRLEQSILSLGQWLSSLEPKMLSLIEQTNRLEQAAEKGADRATASEQKFLETTTEQRERIMEQRERIEEISAEVTILRTAIQKSNESLGRTQLEGRLHNRDVRRFLHELRSGVVAVSSPDKSAPVPQMFATGIKRETDFDYFAFEDLYRGDEADIADRQRTYLEHFRGRQNVLDVGCGRGEFLELLRANNISAKGVELGTDQYLLCEEKGLDVVQQDLFSYLESIPDESLGGLFSAQVIEHLTASDQLRYVALAHQKTTPGSPVIFETINAQCVWAVMRNFFLDPTHVRPIHPETLKFAMESVNFRSVDIRFSSPMSDRIIPPLQVEGAVQFNQRIHELNEFLYGNQDYAAIGWK